MNIYKIVPILMLCLLYTLSGCTSVQPENKFADNPPENNHKAPLKYLIEAGNQLEIKFFYNPDLNENVVVRPDGMISLQLVDDVMAAGLTPKELDDKLTLKYSKELLDPNLTVFVRSFEALRIYVGGEVNNQKIITYTNGLTPLQAVIDAGGFKETASPENTIIIRKGPDNKPLPIFVNLQSRAQGNGENPIYHLRPDDILYVPMSTIGKANKFVNQYVEKLLLFNGVDFGFTYILN